MVALKWNKIGELSDKESALSGLMGEITQF